MPTSDYHQISDVLHIVEQLQPKTVLDIGVGFGKWGMLCREVLEIYKGRVAPDTWAVQIDGIEIHEPYRNPLWELAYDRIYSGDAAVLLPTLRRYDLIVCCDVIEHFDKGAGQEFIQTILHRSEVAIITSPRGFAPQGNIYGNEHERHRSGWTRADFQNVPCLYKDIGFTFMAVISAEELRLRSLDVMHPLRTLGVKKGFAELARLALSHARLRLPGTHHPRAAGNR